MAASPILSSPPVPAYRATWRAIYYEPVSGSGERWTVGIAAADAEGEEIRDTLSPLTLKCLFGEARTHVKAMIDFALDDLRAQLQSGTLLEAITPALEGVFLGPPSPAASQRGRLGVFRQAVYRSTALAAMDGLEQEPNEETAQEQLGSLETRIRLLVTGRKPALERFFNVKMPLFPDGEPIRYGFLRPGRAAQFELLRPDGLGYSRRAARAKLYELAKLRLVEPSYQAAMILATPRDEDLLYSDQQLANAKRSLRELTREAQSDAIALFPAHSDTEAAESLIRFAA